MTDSTHTHPSPARDRLAQYGAAALAAVMVVSVPLQMLLTLLGAPGGLFVMSALVTLVLVPVVLIPTMTAPPVTLTDDGLWLEPRIWPRRFVAWGDVAAAKEFPLLPKKNQEVTRRIFVGRDNYTPADGFMLVIDGLPITYRVVAFFAGETAHGVIAITNRTHTHYDHIKRAIVQRLGEIQPHD